MKAHTQTPTGWANNTATGVVFARSLTPRAIAQTVHTAYHAIMTLNLLIIFVVIGASARLTRLVVEDTITYPIREWVAKKKETSTFFKWVDKLVNCPWCIGFWITALVVGVAHVADGAQWFIMPAFTLTAAHIVGLIATWEEAKNTPMIITTNND